MEGIIMRVNVMCVCILMLAFQATAIAGVDLVNGSFEDGTNNGWSIIAWSTNNYHDPPIQQCVGPHGLTAPDGSYYAGLTYAFGEPDPPTKQECVRYRQGVEVKNYDPNADRTNYEFEIWSQVGWGGEWKHWYRNHQTHTIWWTDDGLMPHDGAHVWQDGGTLADGDTIEVDAAGPNRRVYEFDIGDGIRPTSDVAVVPASGLNYKYSLPEIIAVINADALAPCTASFGPPVNGKLKEVVLTWKDPDANGATVTSEYNAAGKLFPTNFVPAGGAVPHHQQIQFVIPATFITDAADQYARNFDDWRQFTISGSIPGNPQAVVLEVQIWNAEEPDLCHNCFDGVVFSAESATGSSIGPFAGDVAPVYDPPGDPNGALIGYNSGFEIAPYDQSHGGTFNVDPPPGWDIWAGFAYDPLNCASKVNGPIKGYTNGATTPNDPLGIATPEGDHFFGRAKITGSADPCVLEGPHLSGYWGHVIPVRKWSSSAIGLKWRIHYLTKMWDTNNSGFQWLQLCWDAQPGLHSVLDPVIAPNDADMLTHDDRFARLEAFNANDRSITKPVPSEFSGFSEFEQEGEMSTVDVSGVGHVPEHVLLRQRIYVSSGADHLEPFKFMFDKVDFYAEAIHGPDPCGEIAADFDDDGDVDQQDFGYFQLCYTGEGGGILLPPDGPDCSCADLDKDGLDVDSADLTEFEICASGPGILADPGCDDEACCFAFAGGSCEELHPAVCVNRGGTPQGPGTDCDPNPCSE